MSLKRFLVRKQPPMAVFPLGQHTGLTPTVSKRTSLYLKPAAELGSVAHAILIFQA